MISCPELPQMMIHVPVDEDAPRTPRQPAERRMLQPGAVSLPRATKRSTSACRSATSAFHARGGRASSSGAVGDALRERQRHTRSAASGADSGSARSCARPAGRRAPSSGSPRDDRPSPAPTSSPTRPFSPATAAPPDRGFPAGTARPTSSSSTSPGRPEGLHYSRRTTQNSRNSLRKRRAAGSAVSALIVVHAPNWRRVMIHRPV